jgi:hypothetical protein
VGRYDNPGHPQSGTKNLAIGYYPLGMMLFFSVASIAIIIYRLGLVPGLKIHIFTDEQVQDKRIIRVAQVGQI